MEDSTAQKRQRTLSDAEIASTAGHCLKRPQHAQTVSDVGHATAMGSSRMLNGHVHGDNIHGNASTVINNFHVGTYGVPENASTPKPPGTLSKDERHELLERLRFSQLDARLGTLRTAQPNTCIWLQQREDYKDWLDSKDLQGCDGLFWIKGNPGTGKSITMKFLYQTLQHQMRNSNKLVISFFFNARGNEFEKSTLGLYRALLFNLLELEPDVQDALDHCQKGGYHNIVESGWQIQMLKEVFAEAVPKIQAQGKQLYCFVDALDECREDDVQDMVSFLEELVSSTDSRHFRVCFSSRHYPQISIRTRLTIALEKEGNHNEDIRIFIESQLRFEQDVDAGLLQQIRDEILKKSSGIFLWVNLVVHQLNEVLRQDGRMKSVQQRLRNIPAAVMTRPALNGGMPLYYLFQDIIQKDDKRKEDLARITQIVFCAKRPLSPVELYVLLHQKFDIPFDYSEVPHVFLRKHVIEVSKGLVEVTKSASPTVQFIHETVRDFLRGGGFKNLSTETIDRHGHELLMASCLKQIVAPLWEHLDLLAAFRHQGGYRINRVDKVGKDLRVDFRSQANRKFEFLEYASRNLLFHAEELEVMGVPQNHFLESFPIEEWILIHKLFEHSDGPSYNESTPMLHILAGQGCNHLIKSSEDFRSHYATEVEGNECSTALSWAIINGHVDTAWTLVASEVNAWPSNVVAQPRSSDWPKPYSLKSLLLGLGDAHLMRRVLEDCQVTAISVYTEVDLREINSAEMIDLFLELSNVPGFPSVGKRHQPIQAAQEASGPPQPNRDLMYIRRAIEAEPSLLTSKYWGKRTMLDYAISKGLSSIVSLYLEYSDRGQSDVDAVLHLAASAGALEIVKHMATRHNANLGSQNELGETALHLVMVQQPDFGERHATMIRYLLSQDPSCVNVRDFAGRTALFHGITSPAWQYPLFRHREGSPSTLFEAFLQAGADVNFMLRCEMCPESERHLVPLIAFMAFQGLLEEIKTLASITQCDLNGCDNLGRTTLSWCLSYYRDGGTDVNSIHSRYDAGAFLLGQQAVDVNSRDKAGYTILEHFIRRPCSLDRFPVYELFRSEQLDCNLRTSNGQHPLELIVALYDTWPIEFGDINSEEYSNHEGFSRTFKQRRKANQRGFNKHLIRAWELLLGTGKVDIDVQRHCADRAPPELQGIVEPGASHDFPIDLTEEDHEFLE